MISTGSPSNQLSSAEDEVAGNTTLVEMRPLIDALRPCFTEDPPKAQPFTPLGGDDLGNKPY